MCEAIESSKNLLASLMRLSRRTGLFFWLSCARDLSRAMARESKIELSGDVAELTGITLVPEAMPMRCVKDIDVNSALWLMNSFKAGAGLSPRGGKSRIAFCSWGFLQPVHARTSAMGIIDFILSGWRS